MTAEGQGQGQESHANLGVRIAAIGLAVAGVAAIAAVNSGEAEMAAGWHPVNEKSKVVCINPETGEWELSGSAQSSEKSYDANMNFTNAFANHPVLGGISVENATDANPTAKMSARFDGTYESATLEADVNFPSDPQSDTHVDFYGNKPEGCEPEETTTTEAEETTTTVEETTTTEVEETTTTVEETTTTEAEETTTTIAGVTTTTVQPTTTTSTTTTVQPTTTTVAPTTTQPVTEPTPAPAS